MSSSRGLKTYEFWEVGTFLLLFRGGSWTLGESILEVPKRTYPASAGEIIASHGERGGGKGAARRPKLGGTFGIDGSACQRTEPVAVGNPNLTLVLLVRTSQ